MSIRFACHECGKEITVKDEFAGKKGKCLACGTSMLVPAPFKLSLRWPIAMPLRRSKPVVAAAPEPVTPVASKPPKYKSKPYANPLRSGMSSMASGFDTAATVSRVLGIGAMVLGLLVITLISVVLIYFIYQMVRVLFGF